jgi:hypothetical protein
MKMQPARGGPSVENVPSITADRGGTMKTTEMLGAHPASTGLDRELLARVIDTLVSCAQACTACADACLGEEMVADLTTCIRGDLDCADVCDTTARVLSRQTGSDANVNRTLLTACIAACVACGDECERHAGMHEHCRICAEACRACEAACGELLAAVG